MLYISIYMLYIAYMYMQRVHVFFRIYMLYVVIKLNVHYTYYYL